MVRERSRGVERSTALRIAHLVCGCALLIVGTVIRAMTDGGWMMAALMLLGLALVMTSFAAETRR